MAPPSKRLVEAVAAHAYDEWRLGRFGATNGADHRPMWHELDSLTQSALMYRAEQVIKSATPAAPSRTKKRTR